MEKNVNINKETQNPRVLVAPLDWGLGHTTRCIPIIKELISEGCEVYLVADKKTFSLLRKEFPSTVILRYKGYEIEYSRRKCFFTLKLLFQVPAIFYRIIHEKKWLKKTIKTHGITAVISDNRFGMYHKTIPSVYITHQLYIKTGNPIIERLAQKIHLHFINKFTVCWVPDHEENGLAGELSHPQTLPRKLIYIGPLSRFHKVAPLKEIYDLLIILSGPEPQRTIFETEIFQQLKTVDEKIFLVRGLPDEDRKPANFSNVTIENHLGASELNQIIQKSKVVLCRSGYTSVMDLTILQKKAILIPTPGQAEQEYLSKYLLEKGYFFSMQQKDFSIKKALHELHQYDLKPLNAEVNKYKKTVQDFVGFLKTGGQ